MVKYCLSCEVCGKSHLKKKDWLACLRKNTAVNCQKDVNSQETNAQETEIQNIGFSKATHNIDENLALKIKSANPFDC